MLYLFCYLKTAFYHFLGIIAKIKNLLKTGSYVDFL